MNPSGLYIVIAVLVVAQIGTTALLAWLWARVSGMPTHSDIGQLRQEWHKTNERLVDLSETVAGLAGSSEQALHTLHVIQGYLMEGKK